MGSANGDREGPVPGAGEGRDPLFGWREGEEAPDAAPDAAPGPVPDHGAALAELAAGQQRIVALLEGLEEKMQTDAGLDLAEMARTISEATEWTSNIRAGMDELFAATGRHIEGLKGGRRDLDKTAAALHGREQGLGKLIDRFDEDMKVLRGMMQRFEQRSSELGAVKQDLAGYYGRWTEGTAAYREKMDTLSERLDEGERVVSRIHRELESWTEVTAEVMETHAATQRKAAAEASGNVGRVSMTLRYAHVAHQEVEAAARRGSETLSPWPPICLSYNLKIAGSNPSPETTEMPLRTWQFSKALLCADSANSGMASPYSIGQRTFRRAHEGGRPAPPRRQQQFTRTPAAPGN